MNVANLHRYLICSFFCAVLICFTLPSFSQAYFDIPVQLDFYQANSHELNYQRRGFIINPSVGIVLAGSDTTSFELHCGVGIFISKFDHVRGESTFEYTVVGLPQTSLMGYYNAGTDWQIGLGAIFGLFGVIRKGLNPDLDGEYVDRLGEGYNSINFGNSLEVRYHFNRVFSFGMKCTYWYIPQLEYQRISDYGEFLPKQKDLYLTRLEFSVRLYVGGRTN